MPTQDRSPAEAMLAAWRAGQFQRVIALAEGAGAPDVADEQVLALLGLARQQVDQPAQAAEAFARLTRIAPAVPAHWNNLGVALRMAGDPQASEHALLKAKSLAPGDAEVHYNLGLLYLQQRRWPAAREALLEAAQHAPRFAEARLQAAQACHVCGDSDGEAAMLEGAGDWPPMPVAEALLLAGLLSAAGRTDAALQTLARAGLPSGESARPWRLRIAARRVSVLERGNRCAAAHDALREVPVSSLEALPEDAGQAWAEGWRAHAQVAAREGRHADAAMHYRRALERARDPETRAALAFGLAAALDRQAQYQAAWQALELAHAAQLELVREIDPALLEPGSAPLPMAQRAVDASTRARWKPLAAPTGQASPVFVIGFPRSGTTLLEQMLDAHRDLRSMDERGFIHELTERMEAAGQRYPADLENLEQSDVDQLRAVYWNLVARVLPDLGTRTLVDKNPLNMLCLPMILRLFPDARIILCLRHPCDVLTSCSMQSFRSPAFMAMCASLQGLARGYADAFGQCCRHLEVFRPRLLEWRYESVVGDFDGSVDRLGRFLGVADASSMREYATHARAKPFIGTPSYADVTRPVHRAAVGRWHAYREHFGPVLPILRPWIERFGYVI